MAAHGTKVDAYWTQFFAYAPGRPPNGDDYGWDYGGKLDAKIQHDFTKQGWNGVSLTSHIEFRYGDTTLFAGGTLMLTNAAMLLPENEGNAINFTSLYLTKTFGPSTVLQAGRFSAVDLYAKPCTGGEGVDKFMNVAFVAPPLMARTMPFVFEGVLMTSLKGSEPFITAGLLVDAGRLLCEQRHGLWLRRLAAEQVHHARTLRHFGNHSSVKPPARPDAYA